MNVTEIAQALDAMEYRADIGMDILTEARNANIVIVIGASDDLMEFYGAFRDEGNCYDGGTVLVDAKGVVPSVRPDDLDDGDDGDAEMLAYLMRKKSAGRIEALWADEASQASWSYKTDIPHATFNVMEDGGVYCRAMVFALADLPSISS